MTGGKITNHHEAAGALAKPKKPRATPPRRKAIYTVICSNSPTVGTAYLTHIEGETSYIEQKKPTKIAQDTGGGSAAAISTKALSSKVGITRHCAVCDNVEILVCSDCNTPSCATNGLDHCCPSCGRYSPSIFLTNGARVESSAHKKHQKNQSLLTKQNRPKLASSGVHLPPARKH